MTNYFRPLVQMDRTRPAEALPLAGGIGWFTQVEHLRRGRAPDVLPVTALPAEWREALTAPRADIAGMDMARPQIMGILNVTPDSFSDGGRFDAAAQAVAAGVALAQAGADILDVGGESTRPGAKTVPAEDEIQRTAPVIAGLRAAGVTLPISIDTRKAAVAGAALDAGASLVNDVAGFTYDPALAPLCAARAVPVCAMHALGDPEMMQNDPRYDDVLLDVYDYLADRIEALVAQGIARHSIIADPGIGFGKTAAHNLALLNRLSVFQGLGVPILLGASRKRFIGTIGNAPEPADRAPGSIAVALAGIAQGVQIVRVHDVAETRQAVALWQAVTVGKTD
ncbi:dihydropteroate synthase [Aliishimia ponticola]|uniref:Dihydropteroate synthase n=1 Tax=Aliishimia ponticola TaxID=2499833 RepID=A0A4S4NF32_9RHOB|nr:dihydropteroate synthase [Aliishimia ponticola]THH37405.1 dihydropteroate synthase [Aliishimia ponticola]